jgi:hypothetical protein
MFMPNWCNNRLREEGERKDLDAFFADCFSRDEYERIFYDFEKIIPLGETEKIILTNAGNGGERNGTPPIATSGMRGLPLSSGLKRHGHPRSRLSKP